MKDFYDIQALYLTARGMEKTDPMGALERYEAAERMIHENIAKGDDPGKYEQMLVDIRKGYERLTMKE